MPERTFTYEFRGKFTNLGAGLATMSKGVGDLGTKLTALDRQGVTARRGLTTLGTTAGRVGLAAAAGVGAIVLSAANFEQAMSRVKAATGATSDGLEELRTAAIQAGQDTVFSATEAADAITAMSKAGVSAKDILSGGLNGALALASAGELDVAQAADIAATAMNQFGLAGKDIPHIADLLAAGAASAQGEVTDFAQALKYVGPVAHQMGISIEETTGVIAELASQGVLADQAGTSLRGMLTSLTSPSLMAKKQMAALGITLYDSTGQFVGFDGVAQQLHDTLGNLTNAERDQALGRIFGNEQITAARILYAGGAEAVDKWTKAVDKQGAAADIAAIKMDNLKGDLEQLRGSLETAFIGAGSGSQGPLRNLVQGLTSAVNEFNKLPGSMQNTVTGMLAITAITGGGLWFGSKVVRGISDTRQALQDLGTTAPKTSTALRGVATAGVALAGLEVAGGIISALDDAATKAAPNVERLTAALIATDQADFSKQFGDLKDALNNIDPSGLDGVRDSVNDLADKGGFAGRALESGLSSFVGGPGSLDDVRHQADSATEAIGSLDQALTNIATTGGPDKARQAFDALVKSQGLSADEQKRLLDLLPQYQEALVGAANQATLTGDATTGLSASVSDMGDAGQDAAQKIADLVKAMQDERNAAIDAFNATTQYRQAVKDADKQAKHSNAGIADSTKGALKNRDALAALASAWNSQSETVTDNIAKYKDARDNFIKTAVAMGVPEKAAKELAKQLLELPSSKVIPVSTPGMDQATSKARTLKQVLDDLHNKDINIALHYVTLGNKPHAPTPGSGASPRVAPRSADGLTVRVPSMRELAGGKDAYAAQALGLLAKESDEAGKSAKSLKERLHDAEQRLTKMSRAADRAHEALDSLKSQKADLASAVSGSLAHDPFGGTLADFEAQTASDTADAQAVLAALQSLVRNGLDPHSQLFQRLASSGNVSLIQQFAALTGSQLAAEAAAFATGQSALNQVGQFAGGAAFNDLIIKQAKVTDRLDATVKSLHQAVNHLTAEIKHMGKNVHDGAKSGVAEGHDARSRAVAAAAATGGRPMGRSR